MAPTSIYNPVLPFVNSLNCSLHPGVLIRIKGRTNISPINFSINLQCGPSINPRSDIALHFSPVFSAPIRVVRNSLIYQQWGPEESHGGFPFNPDTDYEIMILTEMDHFKIAVNNVHFTEFRYRIMLNLVTHIAADGDTSISQIIFERQSFSPSAPPSHHGGCPYPTESLGMPSPMHSTSSTYPSLPAPYPSSSGPYPPPAYGGSKKHSSYQQQSGMPYPQQVMPYPQQAYNPSSKPSIPTAYPPSGPVAPNMYGAPSGSAGNPYPASGYPTAGYPQQAGYPKQAGYPQSGYPGAYGSTSGYPQPSSSSSTSKHGMFSNIPGASKYIDKIKKSSPIPIGGVAAGLGAAALGAALLGNPMKKMKKLYKHKGFKHKFHKGWSPKGWGHKGWSHKGWSSSSSSSSSD